MLTLLRLFKVLRRRNSQLAQFPSFFYKHVMFTLADHSTILRKHCLAHKWEVHLFTFCFPSLLIYKCMVLARQSVFCTTAPYLYMFLDIFHLLGCLTGLRNLKEIKTTSTLSQHHAVLSCNQRTSIPVSALNCHFFGKDHRNSRILPAVW